MRYTFFRHDCASNLNASQCIPHAYRTNLFYSVPYRLLHRSLGSTVQHPSWDLHKSCCTAVLIEDYGYVSFEFKMYRRFTEKSQRRSVGSFVRSKQFFSNGSTLFRNSLEFLRCAKVKIVEKYTFQKSYSRGRSINDELFHAHR